MSHFTKKEVPLIFCEKIIITTKAFRFGQRLMLTVTLDSLMIDEQTPHRKKKALRQLATLVDLKGSNLGSKAPLSWALSLKLINTFSAIFPFSHVTYD